MDFENIFPPNVGLNIQNLNCTVFFGKNVNTEKIAKGNTDFDAIMSLLGHQNIHILKLLNYSIHSTL